MRGYVLAIARLTLIDKVLWKYCLTGNYSYNYLELYKTHN